VIDGAAAAALDFYIVLHGRVSRAKKQRATSAAANVLHGYLTENQSHSAGPKGQRM